VAQEGNHQAELDHPEEVAQLVAEAPAHPEEVEVLDPQEVAVVEDHQEDHQEAPVEVEVMGSWGGTLLLISMGIAPSQTHSSMSSTFTTCLTSMQNRW